MDSTLSQKYQRLQEIIADRGPMAIAFSGGVDSTLLLFVAHEVLETNALAITAHTPTFPRRELDEAIQFCESIGVEQVVIDYDELEIEGFATNPPNRCYLCKKELFARILSVAREHGISQVAEGSNKDDLEDYRPGLQAIEELGILSPLREAELSKNDIRAISSELNLPTWDKPSFACLASRFVYGQTIDRDALDRVNRAEQFLIDQGFRQVRVRVHGNLARIEVEPDAIARLMDERLRRSMVEKLRSLGFSYVAVDLEGYRSGSMNVDITSPQESDN